MLLFQAYEQLSTASPSGYMHHCLKIEKMLKIFFSHVTLNAVAVFYQIDAEKLIRNCISGAAQRSHSLSEIPQSVPTPSTFTMDQGQEIILFRLQLT